MIEIGKFNQLVISRLENKSVFFNGGDFGSIEMLSKEAPASCQVGDTLQLFVHSDGKGKLFATSRIPHAQADDVAFLKCISVGRVGAFLDWGMAKDLLLPFSEQKGKIIEGRSYLVKVFLDESNRLTASMRLDDFIQDEAFYLQQGQQVDLVIAEPTDLGFKAVVNNQFWGLLYSTDVFQRLSKGQKLKGFIKQIRQDRKLDLTLDQSNYSDKVNLTMRAIMEKLEVQQGVMTITDKSSPEEISNHFGVSKKIFKQALGQLYKQRKIIIDSQVIRLVKK